jgi:hypothetical protein
MNPLVVVLDHGRALAWVQHGRMWLAYRRPTPDLVSYGQVRGEVACFSPWYEVTEDASPDFGGFVLTQAEVARLVPPPVPKETT